MTLVDLFIHCVLPADQLIGLWAVKKNICLLTLLGGFPCLLLARRLVCVLSAGKSAKCKDDIETTSLKKEPRNASRVIIYIFWTFDI
jgi:hypothetical protein